MRWRCGAVVLGASAVLLTATAAHAELVPPTSATVAPLPELGLEPAGTDATALVLMDARTGQVLLARGAEERRPVASTIKMLTALTAVERLDVATPITVGAEVVGVGGAEVGLSPGATWSVEDLLEALLVRSGNEVAEALAVAASGDRATFVVEMERDARRLGLDGIIITSPSGLDDGNRLSALDLATLARATLAHPVLGPIVGRARVELPTVGVVDNRNLLVGSYAGATGVKTGYTAAAGNAIVASASRDGRELLVVILGSGPDPARFRDAVRLLDLGFDGFVEVSVAPEVELASGAGWWRLVPREALTLLVPTVATLDVDVPVPARIGGAVTRARLAVAGRDLGSVELATEPSPVGAGPRRGASATARLAEGVADGAFTALRAAFVAGALG